MFMTPGMEKLFVNNMHPWGELDWFTLKWTYPVWRWIYLLVQHMQMAPQPLNYMMVPNYPWARQCHLELSILTLPLWRGAVECARIAAPGTAPANLSLHSVSLILFSCRRRSLTLLKAGSGFVQSSLLRFDTFIVHSSCSYSPEICPVTESSQQLVTAEKTWVQGVSPFPPLAGGSQCSAYTAQSVGRTATPVLGVRPLSKPRAVGSVSASATPHLNASLKEITAIKRERKKSNTGMAAAWCEPSCG